MSKPKVGKSKGGKEMHFSVGALICKDGKYLLIDRKKPPFGYAGIAGHIDEGEDEITALFREVEEESGLRVEKYKLLFDKEVDWNWCAKGVKSHFWYLFECEVSGEIRKNLAETESIGWYSQGELKKLELEPVWEYWFEKLNIIK